MYVHLARESVFKVVFRPESRDLAFGFFGPKSIKPHNVRNQSLVTPLKKAENVQNTGYGPRSIGAPAKSKKEETITSLILAHEETVSIRDIVEQPRTKSQTLRTGPLLLQPSARVRCPHGADSRMVVTDLLWINKKGAIDFHDVGVAIRVVETISGTVAA